MSAPWDAPASINAPSLEKDDDSGINQTGDHETYKSRLRMDSAPRVDEPLTLSLHPCPPTGGSCDKHRHCPLGQELSLRVPTVLCSGWRCTWDAALIGDSGCVGARGVAEAAHGETAA